jgi:hypothetical protein
MSLRTLVEINHDYSVRDQTELLQALQLYLNSGDQRCAERLERFGFKVLAMRHHSGQFHFDKRPEGFPKDPTHDV